MSTQELENEAMALPLVERVLLAQTLWQNITLGMGDENVEDALQDAVRRDQELSSGTVVGRSHDAVMKAAKSAIGCV